jgi:uncharacterized protein (DUF427 family)
MMGLSWQQGPLGRDPNGTLLTATPMPERVLFVEQLRRRMSVVLGGSTTARSDGAILLFEPAHYERILGHAADPYHRIDIRRTARHLVVRQDDRVVADTHAPLVLYESGFAPRWYVPRTDIAAAALHAVEGQTFCPYKGLASYYDIADTRNAAWSYRAPFEEAARIAGQNVIPHGPDHNLSADEIGGIQRVEDAAAAEA